MVIRGLECFRRYFAPYSDQFVLIGGVACALLMEEMGLEFRATKDFDLVLHLEALDVQFVDKFWKFIEEGGYAHRQRSSGKEIFYRFSYPIHKEYPAMVELFSRAPELVTPSSRGNLTPISVGDEVASLSAILLDDDYYQFVHGGKVYVESLPVVRPAHLIPLKARASIDLFERRMQGDHVDERDIRKHRNDVLRLTQLISPRESVSLPVSIQRDMEKFLDSIGAHSLNLKQLGVSNGEPSDLLQMLREIYLVPAALSPLA